MKESKKHKKKVYLSSLGSMGRKHLIGLLKKGYTVEAYDPDVNTFDKAHKDIQEEKLDNSDLIKVDMPNKKYEYAIFSETVPSRLKNFKTFLNISHAKNILLEKPLSSSPDEYKLFLKLAKEKGIEKNIQVNFIRRSWPHVKKIFDYCKNEDEFVMTINGGAIGIGCNGIHFIDKFIYLSNEEKPILNWVKLSNKTIQSGRGKQFFDYGGNFVLTSSKGAFFASISSNSSSNVVMTVKGKNFIITVDYNDFSWKILERDKYSTLPVYRYGSEYKVIENGFFKIPNVSTFIKNWTEKKISLPNLEIANISHKCLYDILKYGEASYPYSFT